MLLDVSQELLELGLSSSALVVRGIDNSRIVPELLAYRRHAGKQLAGHWKRRSISSHPAIVEYHRIHAEYGVADEPPAPEKLIMYVRRNQDFTSSGAIVDCYNIVSAKTLLSIGAHDLDKLALPVSLRICTAADAFVPLGQAERQPVAGEYGYVADDGRVICRLDVLQGDFSKTTRDSRDVVFFLQGNRCLSSATLLKGTWLLAEMVERFTGGRAEIAAFLDAGAGRTAAAGRPQVAFEDFQGLKLRTATIAGVQPLPGFPALSAVTVTGQQQAEVLAPTSSLPADAVGSRAIVACGLHPVKVGESQFGNYLITVSNAERAEMLAVQSPIPDGLRLY